MTLSPKLGPMCLKGSLQASQSKGQSQPQTPAGQREMREERGKWRKKSHSQTKTREFAYITPNTYGEGTWWDLQRETQNEHKWGNTILGLRDSRALGELMVTDKKPDKMKQTKCWAQQTKPGFECVLLEKSLEKLLHGCGCSIPAAPQIPPKVTTLPKANSFLKLMKMKPKFLVIITILPRWADKDTNSVCVSTVPKVFWTGSIWLWSSPGQPEQAPRVSKLLRLPDFQHRPIP